MTARYTTIEGLSFSKNSDREIFELWKSSDTAVLIRKTIAGDEIVTQKLQRILTVSGKGEALPQCTLKPGDLTTVTLTQNSEALNMRFDS